MQAYIVNDVCVNSKYPYIPGASYEAFPDATDSMYEEIMSGKHKYIFGTKYSDGVWNIYDGERRDNVNALIAERYTPLAVSDAYTYVMFIRND